MFQRSTGKCLPVAVLPTKRLFKGHKIQRRDRGVQVGIFIVFLMTIPSLCAQAQQNNPENNEETGASVSRVTIPDPNNQVVLEEVIVIGQHSISTIRRQMFNTQDLVYDTFNELNNEDEYDMVCVNEARIGSQIKYKMCRPRFMMEATSDAYVDWRDNGLAAVNMAEIHKKSMRQREIMADLANNNPQFMSQLEKRLALKNAYKSKLNQCGRNIKCLNKNSR